MGFLYRLIAFIPLSVHAAFAAAVAEHLPARLGMTVDAPGIDTNECLIGWALLVGLCNLSFVLLYLKMPTFKDKSLSLPGLPRSLGPEMREELVRRLRGVAETALLGMNVFFLAVFQAVYQANAAHPLIRFPVPVLLVGFMLVPLLLIAGHVGLTIHSVRGRFPSSDTV